MHGARGGTDARRVAHARVEREAGRASPPGLLRGGGRRRPGEGPAERGTILAGYRLVRLIGRGEHAEVYLGQPLHRDGASEDGSGNVAVKVVLASRRSRGDAEILALQAVDSEHVVRLLDVATLGDGGLCLVQSLCARGTAAALVGRRGGLTPGEVVTLIASVLRGLGDLHEAGMAHGALDLTHVLVDASGRPVLGGLGSARVPGAADADHAAAAPLPGTDPIEHDLARVARMAAALRPARDPRTGPSGSSWDAWLTLLDDAVHGESDLDAHDLADRLLEVADAAPLADAVAGDPEDAGAAAFRDAAPASPRTTSTARARDAARRSPETPPAGAAGTHRHRAERESFGRRSAGRLRVVRGSVARELAVVRPRVWIGGTAALLVAISGAVAVPMLAAAAHDTPPAAVDPTAPLSPATDGDTPAPAAPGPAEPSADAVATGSPDPDVAAPALLRLRAACLGSGTEGCLAGVDQPDSAMEDADRAASRSGPQDGAELHESDRLDRAQRLGDTALITLHANGEEAPGRRPASLLIVRGEAGWRIRDLMDDR